MKSSEKLEYREMKELASEDSDSDADVYCCPQNPNLRDRIYNLFDNPNSSSSAKFFSLFIMALILWSTGSFVLESVSEVYDAYPKEFWQTSEVFCVFWFTVEYIMRLTTSRHRIAFIFGAMNIIDFLAIFPFYVDIITAGAGGSSSTFLRVLRLFRVFRIFKMGKYSQGMQMFATTLSASMSSLSLLLFYLFIGIVVLSSMIFFAEQGTPVTLDDGSVEYRRPGEDEPSPFTSIPASFWWCLITMTTVGYGDVFPITIPGKLIGSFTALAGILVLALPINVIGSNFVDVFSAAQRKQQLSEEAPVFRTHREKADYYQTRCGDLVRVLNSMQDAVQDAQRLIKELQVTNAANITAKADRSPADQSATEGEAL